MRKIVLVLLAFGLIGCARKDKLDEDTAVKAAKAMLDDRATLITQIGRA